VEEKMSEPTYLTKERVKHLLAFAQASHVCIGYYGPGASEARRECIKTVLKQLKPKISEEIDRFAETDPEAFKKWLVDLEKGLGLGRR
jgi:hypothetical protein